MGELRARPDRMTGWGGMMKQDNITKEVAGMMGYVEVLAGVDKMRVWAKMVIGLAKMVTGLAEIMVQFL